VLAQNPEALIPHLAAAGVPVPPQQPPQQLADASGGVYGAAPTFDDRFGAATGQAPMIPSSGSIGGPSPYEQPASAGASTPEPHLSASDVTGRAKDYYSSQFPLLSGLLSKGMENVMNYGRTGTGANAPKDQARVAPSEPGRVPPSALGVTTGPQQAQAAEPATDDNRVADEPYTPSYKTASVEGGGETATPASDPRKAAAATDTKPALGRALSAFSGVKAPPAPAQPQVRPFTERPANFPTSSPIAAALAEMMSGKPNPNLNALRLLAATGGR
jgi:hypothetical protein